MDKNSREECFDIFIKNYKDNKLKLIWRKNSLGVLNNGMDDKSLLSRPDFREFVSNLTDALKYKVLENQENNEYNEYVNRILREDENLKLDIIVRSMSNNNICNFFNPEILTKRDKNLKIEGYSALINLNLEKPNIGENLLQQVSFELSLKDLLEFRETLDRTIKNIEKLKLDMK